MKCKIFLLADAEISAATGLNASEVFHMAKERFGIHDRNRPVRAADAPLLVLPYPGGRHPVVSENSITPGPSENQLIRDGSGSPIRFALRDKAKQESMMDAFKLILVSLAAGRIASSSR